MKQFHFHFQLGPSNLYSYAKVQTTNYENEYEYTTISNLQEKTRAM